jgi:phage-related integrase
MEKGNKVSTRNSRLASVKAFCHYAQYKDFKNLARWQDILSIKSKKADMPYMSFLTQEGMKTLLSEVPTDTIQGRRHLAILAFLYDTGARANELISFSAHNLNLTKPYHVILSGKGRKKRIVPIHEKLVLILKAYMKDANIELNNISKQPLFVNAYGRKLTSAGLTHIIMMYADKVRENFPALMPKRLSPHSFRHSKATHLLQAGMNIIYVRDFLGHSSVKTTETYVRMDSEQKRKALEAAAADIVPQSQTIEVWNDDEKLLNWLKGLGK